MEKEAKKEAFRKYLESSGVVDVLTKALVALYEENDRPSSAIEFIQQKLGGPTISEYEKLQAEKTDLQLKYDDLLTTYKDTCKERLYNVMVESLQMQPLKSYPQRTRNPIKDLKDAMNPLNPSEPKPL